MNKQKLIACVFAREPLWDKHNKNHHNSTLLTKLWKEISVECNTKVILAKAQWKRLRETFKKKLIEMVRDGGENNDWKKPDWQYFDSLMFLRNQFLTENSIGNFEERRNSETPRKTEEAEENSARNGFEEDLSDNESQLATPYSFDISTLSKPKHTVPVAPMIKKRKTQELSETNDTVGIAPPKVEEEVKELDEDEAFFRSILSYVKAMNPKINWDSVYVLCS